MGLRTNGIVNTATIPIKTLKSLGDRFSGIGLLHWSTYRESALLASRIVLMNRWMVPTRHRLIAGGGT
jgi:hypothetical protein